MTRRNLLSARGRMWGLWQSHCLQEGEVQPRRQLLNSIFLSLQVQPLQCRTRPPATYGLE